MMKRLLFAMTLALTSLSVASGAFAESAAPGRAAALSAVRETQLLKDGWRFHLGDAPGAERVDFPDSDWARVSVPHTWNRVGHYLSGSPDRVNTPDKLNTVQGVGWYRLAFTPPVDLRGKRAWLQFDAASRTAEVWLNGVRLGGHAGGFSRFRLDATAALRPGVLNLLAVKTDNSKPTPGAATADVLPLAGDFFVEGGLYRPVALVATHSVHFDMADFGGPGVYATTTAIAERTAQVAVRSRVRNDSLAAMRLSVVARLVDAGGSSAAEQTRSITLPPGADASVEQALRLPEARLWQGAEDPYLYNLVVEIRDRRGAVVDRLDQPFGVRQMRFDPEKGFFLNGKPLRLRGVGLHQDQEGKGWARDEADVAADIAILREMGANTIRLTHYQHGPTIHELADRYGLILWDEIPLVTIWAPAGQTQPTPGLVQNAEQQLRELIRQNYNHASVATWGIANEVDMGDSLPSFMTGLSPDADPLPLLEQLASLARQEDASRPTVQAGCCEEVPFRPGVKIPAVAPATDLLGVNRYFGWYFGEVSDLGPHLDSLHRKRPNQPLAVSEYGAGGALTIHTDDPLGGPADSHGRIQPEEYQTWIHEQSWASLKDRPYLWATWLWNAFDFATSLRREGDADDINTKGLITYDRKVKKDAFYFYQANWSPAATVHINGRRYVDRAYAVTEVRVFSNAPTTELTINGRSIGVRGECPQMTCIWKDVRLAPGPNLLVSTGRFASGDVRDEVGWTLGPDAARSLRIDSGALVAAASRSGKTFGSDAFVSGGTAKSLNRQADYGRPAENTSVAGADDPEIAATYREGEFRYRLPLQDGRYRVTLTFVEPMAAAGEREFDVLANGAVKLKRFDVAKAAKAPLTSVKRSFLADARANLLDLQFVPRKGAAIVSAVEIEPQ